MSRLKSSLLSLLVELYVIWCWNKYEIRCNLSLKRVSYFDRDTELGPKFPRSASTLFGQDPTLYGLLFTGLTRASAPVVTQMTNYASTLFLMRKTSFAWADEILPTFVVLVVLFLQSKNVKIEVMTDEITVQIKGTASQVQTASSLLRIRLMVLRQDVLLVNEFQKSLCHSYHEHGQKMLFNLSLVIFLSSTIM